MHPLVQALTSQFRLIGHTHPILLKLLEMGAAATPRETSRPVRRKQQMRMLRQWRRLEEAFAEFIKAKVTDEDLVHCAYTTGLEPFYLENTGWLAPGTDPEDLRSVITVLLTSATTNKINSTPPLSYFKTKTSTIMKAPQRLEDQFNSVVTSSEPSNTALDKFLRGSLRSSNALAALLEHAQDPEGDLDSSKTQAIIKEAEEALAAQGFTF